MDQLGRQRVQSVRGQPGQLRLQSNWAGTVQPHQGTVRVSGPALHGRHSLDSSGDPPAGDGQ